jgi:hypothetical protein
MYHIPVLNDKMLKSPLYNGRSFHTDMSMIMNDKCNNQQQKKRYFSTLWSWFLQASRGTAHVNITVVS